MQLYVRTPEAMHPQFEGLELVPTPVVVFDPERRVRVWNRAAEELLGWSAEEVMGHLDPSVPPERIDEYPTLAGRVRAGETIRDFETIRIRRDGTNVTVSLTIRLILDPKRDPWIVVSAFDVSECRRMRVELDEGRRRYRALANELRGAQGQREELVRLLVHDFKTPISVVLSALHYVAHVRELDEETREAVSDAIGSTEALNDMTLNLLDISRSEDGNLVPKRAETDLPQILAHVIDQSSRFRAVPVELTCEGAKSAFVDRDLLRRVARNLIDNACKYGGGSPVAVSCEMSAGVLRIAVADQGPGIPAAARDRIFEKYYRTGAGVSDMRPSHGLGLTFCKLAVEAHGGTIHVTENTPRGCRFIVEIPAI